MMRELGSSLTGQWQLFSFCEHGNESSNTITRVKFLDFISYYLFFKDSVNCIVYCISLYCIVLC